MSIEVLPFGAENVNVYKEDPTSPKWYDYSDNVTLTVTWNTSALSDDVDTVNVVIFRYYENIPTWQECGKEILMEIIHSLP